VNVAPLAKAANNESTNQMRQMGRDFSMVMRRMPVVGRSRPRGGSICGGVLARRRMTTQPKVVVRATPGGGETPPEDDQLGSMFQRELQKRNISSIDDIQELSSSRRPTSSSSSSSNDEGYIPPPQFASGFGPKDEEEDDGVGGDQLARSRRIGSEGLDGLIPRGSQLLTLGATSFLAFGPFILFVLVSFGAVWLVWGDLFVHGGSVSSGPPVYLDPYDLLAEPTADPMIPM